MPFLANVSHTGVTLHYIDNGIDTGPILQQISFPITLEDTARSLYFKYNQYALSLFKKNIINLLNNTLQSYPQPAEGSTYFSKHVIDFKHITIDLNKTSYEIHNQLRAFIFPEYQLPQLSGQYISHTILTQQQIGYNYYEQNKNSIILSGIDGYKIITTVDPTYQKQK